MGVITNYAYNSIYHHRSAISAFHEGFEGVSVGDHPRVCKLMAGISNENPPQPKFTQVWDVAVVLEHLEGLEEPLSGKLLTLKTVMLIAL